MGFDLKGLEAVMWLAALGLLSGVVAGVYAVYWLFTHISFTG